MSEFFMDKQYIKSNIPEFVSSIGKMLEKEGFCCYLVGGAVRDLIMKRTPKDFDLTSNAKPEEIIKIFSTSIATGIKFGTVTVIVSDDKGENHPVEVTTFRSEEDYVSGRWPTNVEFTGDIHKDLSRRDFTINAIAIKIPIINDFEIIDPFQGVSDIRKKIIRAVRDPNERFQEDGLRTYKACRLASTLGFTIENKTFEAIPEFLTIAAQVSKERIRDEFMKMVNDSPKPSRGIEIMRKSGLLALFLPELLEGYHTEGGPYHKLTVYEHSLKAIDKAPDNIKLAALFHDIAKPRCADNEGHFYGHAQMGKKMTEKIMRRLRFSNDEIKRVANLVRWHMFYYPYENEKKSVTFPNVLKRRGIGKKERSLLYKRVDKLKSERKKAFKNGWSDKAIRRLIRHMGGKEKVDQLLELRVADALANPKSSFNPEEIQGLEERISKVLQNELALSVTDLDITGEEIIKLGVAKGPLVGTVLNHLLELVEEDPMNNDNTKLKELTKKYLINRGK